MNEILKEHYAVEMMPTRWGWAWAISLPRPGRPPNPGIFREVWTPFRDRSVNLFGVWHERQTFGWRLTKASAERAATRAIQRDRKSKSRLAAAQAGYEVEARP